MALTYPTMTFPCSVNSIPFHPAINPRRSLDAMNNYGTTNYIDSLLTWQTKLPYLNKRLFNDYITLQFKTQMNSAMDIYHSPVLYTNFAKLNLCKSKIGDKGYPVPDNIISTYTTALNGTSLSSSITKAPLSGTNFLWGVQRANYDNYNNPIDSTQTPLVSYMYQFTASALGLNLLTDSGIYFLRFDNYDVDGGIQTWYSEPILFYGNDALQTFPLTLEFECANSINKNDIIIDNWFNNTLHAQVVNTIRVEGTILELEFKGIYLGYLQQDWLASNTYTKSWKTWNLGIGNITSGVPSTMFEIITKIMEMDYVLINNNYYVYDVASGGSQSPTSAWKVDKNRVKGLYRGSLPIRFMFDNEFYQGSPIALPHIFDSTFDGVFS